MIPVAAIQKLKTALARIDHNSPYPDCQAAAESRGAKVEVIAKYGTMFAPEAIDSLTAEDFKSFLLIRNNHHWDSIHRQGGLMTANMDCLKKGLKLLVDETMPIRERLNQLRPGGAEGQGLVKGLGRAVITPILQVVYPEKYGVWNSTAEAGLKATGLWPDFSKSASFGERYETINGILTEAAGALDIDLWTLDCLWWILPDQTGEDGPIIEPPPADAIFGLEKYLHEFLVDNWQQTALGSEWALLEEDGEVVGSHYQTGEVGEIDLLAKHKTGKKWLVIELKRSQSSDVTAGQLFRYMGWVRKKLAKPTEEVHGLIICGEPDLKLQYAICGNPNVQCMTYAVNFKLNTVESLG